MKNNSISLYTPDALLDRLIYSTNRKNKRIVFLLGSPVCMPTSGGVGVPGVDGIVELIRNEFMNDSIALRSLSMSLESAGTNVYQTAIDFLLGRRGQDSVNSIIKKAVYKARLNAGILTDEIYTESDDDAEKYEADFTGWHIPKCLNQLAKLTERFPETFGKLQLTTNFDPLFSIAIQANGGHCYRSVLSKDGSLSQVQGSGCHIVHLHGYWRGVDTLHTPRQLNQPRPRLKSSLADLLKNCIVVPVAYSGWDDLFVNTLLDVVGDDGARPEILWTYYSENDADILSQNQTQLEKFSQGIDSGRLSLYKGIDCNKLFDDLASALLPSKLENNYIKSAGSADNEANNSLNGKKQLSSELDGLFDDSKSGDSIPLVPNLVGRTSEIARLSDPENKIVSIGGIGGQGKSCVAAYYALDCKKSGKYAFVEWRDCREQNDTLYTILFKTVISFKGESSIESLNDVSLDRLVGILANFLYERKGIIVFDNVDHYVDLQTANPIGALKVLLDGLRPADLKTQLIFTSRPLLKFESTATDSIMLKGLSEIDSRNLFEQKSGFSLSQTDFHSLYQLTEGHPLWILLIASRCKQQKVEPKTVLDDIRSGKGDLPERTILSIWKTLTDKQKIVLRTLAELERPLAESEIGDIDFNLNYQQFTKAVKSLKLLGLIELRENDDGAEVLGLHPLIRQFVRSNFPKRDREQFISRIVLLFDRRLSVLKEMFKSDFPVSALEIWTHKIDLSINGGNTAEAIDSLFEISSQLEKNGLHEEFIRLSIRIFEQIDWISTCATSSKFNKLWARSISAFSQFGDFKRADVYIEKYESSIQGYGHQYINLCDAKCYRYWFENEFEQAIYYGDQGVSIKSASQVDTDFDCKHNLALAKRDSGKIEEALSYFLGQSTESEVLDKTVIDSHKEGAFYGNIGRCYFLKGDIEKALVCYKKSARLLEKERTDVPNRGYIRLWIAQALEKIGRVEDAAIFFRGAHAMWDGFVPLRAQLSENELKALLAEHKKLDRVMEMPTWRLENRFQQWVSEPFSEQ